MILRECLYSQNREEYYKTLKRCDVILDGDATVVLGNHTFRMLHTPGHTAGQMAVHVPEEKLVFTGDTVFSHCQTWLMVSDVDQWLAALDTIASLDVERIVPGHGPVVGTRLSQRTTISTSKLGLSSGRRFGERLDTGRGERAHFFCEHVPGRHRAGIHDGLHPEIERQFAIRQTLVHTRRTGAASQRASIIEPSRIRRALRGRVNGSCCDRKKASVKNAI